MNPAAAAIRTRLPFAGSRATHSSSMFSSVSRSSPVSSRTGRTRTLDGI